MTQEEYIEKVNSGEIQIADLRFFQRVWKRVEEYEQKIGRRLEDGYTWEEYIEMYRGLPIYDTTTFRVYKSNIVKFLTLCVKDGTLQKKYLQILKGVDYYDVPIERSCGRIVYHRDLPDLEKHLDKAIRGSDSFGGGTSLEEVLSGEVDGGLLGKISMVYLVWFGFTNDDLIALKKRDVSKEGVLRNGDLIEMPKHVTEALCRFRDSWGYMTETDSRTAKQFYCQSQYLFRTTRAPQIKEQGIRNSLTSLNSSSDSVNGISYVVIRKSGIFHRIYQREQSGGYFDLMDRRFAEEMFDQKISAESKLYVLISDYEYYKKLYYEKQSD